MLLMRDETLIALLAIIVAIAIFMWNRKIVNDNAKRDAAKKYVQRYQDQHNLKKYYDESHSRKEVFFMNRLLS